MKGSIKAVKAGDGSVLGDDSEILKRWGEYFASLLNPLVPPEVEEQFDVDGADSGIIISYEEVFKAIKVLKK
jgi:hypothetical protein